MKVQAVQTLEEAEADTVVAGLFEDQSVAESGAAELDSQLGGRAQGLVETGEAKGALKKTAILHTDGALPAARLLLCGLGKREEFDPERARVAAAATLRAASAAGAKRLAWTLPPASEADQVAGALVEGTLLADYRFDRYKTAGEDDEDPPGLEALAIVGDGITDAVEAGRVVTEAQNSARDLQNLPANDLTPTDLAAHAVKLAAAVDGLEVEVMDRAWMAEQGMGAFLCVAQGTHADPKLIVLRYQGAGEDAETLSLVGKGVTFDTGGISIKPAAKMEEMKFDMSGAAAVIEATGAVARLGLPVNLLTLAGATENMPSGHAVKPGDVVKAMNGKTIEVNNTDAEGRLVLADCLAWAVSQGADRLVDLATLTGAIIVALGSTYAGLMSNDESWAEQVEQAATETGELAWRLPLHPEFKDLTRGKVADLTNTGNERKAMSALAASFLEEFVDGKPWAHLDIAGTAWDTARDYYGKGASGYGVRLLVALAREQSAA